MCTQKTAACSANVTARNLGWKKEEKNKLWRRKEAWEWIHFQWQLEQITQTWGCKATETDSSQSWKPEVQSKGQSLYGNKGVWQNCTPSGGSGGESIPCLSPLLTVKSFRHSLACGCITAVFKVSTFTLFSLYLNITFSSVCLPIKYRSAFLLQGFMHLNSQFTQTEYIFISSS